MSRNKSKIPEKLKNIAVSFIGSWAQDILDNYQEPIREGTSKGDPIGFSRKKMHAACLMVLFPSCYSLKDIAKATDVPLGTIKIWRIQEDFKDVSIKIAVDLGEDLAKKIISKIDDLNLIIDYIDVLSCLDAVCKDACMSRLRENLNESMYSSILLRLYRPDQSNPEVDKIVIAEAFKLLLNQDIPIEKRTEVAGDLKAWMLRLMEGE